MLCDVASGVASRALCCGSRARLSILPLNSLQAALKSADAASGAAGAVPPHQHAADGNRRGLAVPIYVDIAERNAVCLSLPCQRYGGAHRAGLLSLPGRLLALAQTGTSMCRHGPRDAEAYADESDDDGGQIHAGQNSLKAVVIFVMTTVGCLLM